MDFPCHGNLPLGMDFYYDDFKRMLKDKEEELI